MGAMKGFQIKHWLCRVLFCVVSAAWAEGAELIRHFSFDNGFEESLTKQMPERIVGQPEIVPSISMQGLRLDGSSALCYPDAEDLYLETFSITAWVYPHKDYISANIAGKGSDIYWLFAGNGMVKAGFYDDRFNEAFSSTFLRKDRWYFLVVTYDGENVRLYVDNLLHWILPVVSVPRALEGSFIIGAEETEPLTYFADATLDEIRLYEGALGVDDIRDLYREVIVADE